MNQLTLEAGDLRPGDHFSSGGPMVTHHHWRVDKILETLPSGAVWLKVTDVRDGVGFQLVLKGDTRKSVRRPMPMV